MIIIWEILGLLWLFAAPFTWFRLMARIKCVWRGLDGDKLVFVSLVSGLVCLIAWFIPALLLILLPRKCPR